MRGFRIGQGAVVFVMLIASLAEARAAERIGVVAAVRGPVTATAPAVAPRELTSGTAVFKGEVIRSGANSGAQIMLLDETVFTVGPDSELVLDEAIYDPRAATGKVGISIVKGALRFVTGKAAQAQPENMQIKLPVGTIGVRGTMGAIFAGAAASAPGLGLPPGANPSVVVALLGPGIDGEGTDRTGAIDVSLGGRTETLRRGGYGIGLSGTTLLAPFRMPGTALALFVPPPRQGGSGGGASAAAAAASLQGDTKRSLTGALLAQKPANDLGDTVRLVQSSASGGSPTTAGDLLALGASVGFAGQINYAQTGVPILLNGAAAGSYDVSMGVQFGPRSFNGNFVNIQVPALGVGGGAISIFPTTPGADFSAGGSALASATNVAAIGPATGKATFSFVNAGEVLPTLIHRLELAAGGQTAVGSGRATGTYVP